MMKRSMKGTKAPHSPKMGSKSIYKFPYRGKKSSVGKKG